MKAISKEDGAAGDVLRVINADVFNANGLFAYAIIRLARAQEEANRIARAQLERDLSAATRGTES